MRPLVKLEFDSIADIAHYASLPLKDEHLYASRWATKEVTGTKNFEQAYKYLTDGWHYGLNTILKQVEPITMAVKKKQVSFDVIGKELDMGRYIEGIPECYINRKSRHEDVIVSMLINVGAVKSINQQQMLNGCLLISAIADALDSAGLQTHIIPYVYSVAKNGKHLLMTFDLKKPDQRLSLLDMSFVLGHPSFLRRIVWAIRERHPVIQQEFGMHYNIGSYFHSRILPKELAGDVLPNDKMHRVYSHALGIANNMSKNQIIQAASDEVDKIIREVREIVSNFSH